jgi:hypothetical protein
MFTGRLTSPWPFRPAKIDIISNRSPVVALISPKRSFIVPSHKLWVIAVCLVSSAISACGSSLVALVTPERVIIATDGIETIFQNGQSTFHTICKIRQVGNTFYGVVGDYGNPNTQSDIWTVTESAVKRSRTILGIYDAVEPAVFKLLPDAIKRSRVTDPVGYANWLAGGTVVGMVFASFDQGMPIAVGIDFKVDKTGVPQHPQPNILKAVSGSTGTALYGHYQAMEPMILSPIWEGTFNSAPIKASRQLIQAEIDAANKEGRRDVGPPISIVEITNEGGGFAPGYKRACP